MPSSASSMKYSGRGRCWYAVGRPNRAGAVRSSTGGVSFTVFSLRRGGGSGVVDAAVGVEELAVLVAAVLQKVVVQAAAGGVLEPAVRGLEGGDELLPEQEGVSFGPVEPDRLAHESLEQAVLVGEVADRGADGQQVQVE